MSTGNKKFDKKKIDILLYHGGCYDGFCCAVICWLYYKKNNLEDNIKYIPVGYYKKKPPVGNTNLLICDFSYKIDAMKEIIEETESLLIIDHHKTSEEDLNSIPEENKIFDRNYSAAGLTWNYFFPNEEMPMLVKRIQDRDIWTKKYDDNDKFVAWFYNQPFEFDIFEKYINDEVMLQNCIDNIGSFMLDKNLKDIDYSTKSAALQLVELNGNYYFVGSVNSTVLKSDIGNKIMKKYPYIDFSIVHSTTSYKNSTMISLRSTNKNTGVDEIAKLFEGGGHRNASGCVLTYLANSIGKIVCVWDEPITSLLECHNSTFHVKSKNININTIYINRRRKELSKYYLQKTSITDFDDPIQQYQRLKYIETGSLPEPIGLVISFYIASNGDANKIKYHFNFDKDMDHEIIEYIKDKMELDDDYSIEKPSKEDLFMIDL